jgi:hypothetical protein
MLITPSDFVGEYRLFNADNLDPDVVRAINDAQAELARDLFIRGASFIINNSPSDPPNLGLSALGLRRLFIPWVFLRLELGILGAGIKRTSDVPGRSRFATGAFLAIAREYKYFLNNWLPYEKPMTAHVTSPSLLAIPIVASQILAPDMEIEIDGNIYTVVASSTGLLTITPPLSTSATTIRFRQLSLAVDRKWCYF